MISENFPLRKYENTKNRERRLFIARLTLNDTEMDKSLGEKLAEETSNYFWK